MKAERKITNRITPGNPDLSSQQTADCQGYEHQQAIKARCFHPSGIFEEFSREDLESSIPKRFEKIVSIHSERLAVKENNSTLTYDKLNKAANRVAHAVLAERGGNPEPIGLLFSGQMQAIVAILGVLKAGKFYVPLDTYSPAERNGSIIEDCKTELLLTDRVNLELARQLGTNQKLSLIETDDLNKDLADYNPRVSLSADDSMCILYTSGSTGQPKGVLHRHRHSLHRTKVDTNQYHICPYDRLTMLNRYTVTSSLHNMLGALLNGASLHPFDARRGGAELASWLISEEISIYHSVVIVLRQLFDALCGTEEFPNLRVIRLSGMPITWEDVERYKKHFPSQSILLHVMGSTEAGTVPHFFIDHSTRCVDSTVPVGYAEDDASISLVDENGVEVGSSEIGEIAITSPFLAEGYWQDPELTKAKFLPDPNSQNKRIYLTGDLGRKGPDGCLYHLGRKDLQVNIRGFRVETSEIERVLSNHKAIKEVVVTAQNDKFGDVRLVAYFIPNGKLEPKISELHRLLKQKLPQYMIPSAFVRVNAFPLLPSGKIDRKALVSPSDLRPDLESPFIAPHTAVEAELTRIWADVLGLDQVGIQDDFFELGGHSLLAAKLFARIKKTFGKELSPTTLLYARTIEQLADIVREEVKSEPASLLVPLQTKGTKPPFFWVGGFEIDIHLPRLLGQNQPLYGLLNQCHDGHRPLYNRLEDIAAHHLKEIRAVQSRGPFYLGGLCFGGMVAFEMAQQLKRQGQEVALLFCLDLGTLRNVKALTGRLEDSPVTLPKTESFRDYLFRHLSTLAKLKLRERLTYLGVRVLDRINGFVSRGSNVFKRLYVRLCLATGRPIPPSSQRSLINIIDVRVMREYKPQPYTGRIIHIKAEGNNWNPQLVPMLSTGELETYELSCNHAGLAQEPHISIWTEWLKSHLQTAQRSQRGAPPSLSSRGAREEATAN